MPPSASCPAWCSPGAAVARGRTPPNGAGACCARTSAASPPASRYWASSSAKRKASGGREPPESRPTQGAHAPRSPPLPTIQRRCPMSRLVLAGSLGLVTLLALSETPPKPAAPSTYQRLLAHVRSVPAIDTHDHLWPFDKLPGFVETERGKGMNLAGLWRNSYYTWVHPLTAWKPGGKFADWWARAKHDFADAKT